jgi:hypothetical protein
LEVEIQDPFPHLDNYNSFAYLRTINHWKTIGLHGRRFVKERERRMISIGKEYMCCVEA